MATIILKYPIKFHDQTVSEITLADRVKLSHLKQMDAATGEIGKISALIGALANLPVYAVDQLDGEDLSPIMEEIGSFLDLSQTIGGK